MRVFGLIGYPLSHSFSKKYFTQKFEREGLAGCIYENFPIPSVDELKTILKTPGLEGLNVTIPYKESVLSYLHEVSDDVSKIKACNCIRIRNGKLTGFNTDIFGFEHSLRKILNPEIHKKALILGTGGSAKAVRFVLTSMGIPFKKVSRKPKADQFSYEQLTGDLMAAYQVIINTTPLGMFPNIIEAPQIPYQFLSSNHLLFDLLYNPEKTLFLKKGEDRGAQIRNGYDMLVLQAEENWRIWNED